MNILGIETSCDETAAAVVNNGRRILSNVVVSSLKQHQPFGGVIPEIASRRQLEYIQSVTRQALIDSTIPLKRIDAVAATTTPGLIGSLLVGTSFAKALSHSLSKPFIAVDHIKAHIYANFLTNQSLKEKKKPKFPAIGLVVSGGHTSLYHMKNPQHFSLIGQTLDDAVGEAYDKVARILELGYPGGPIIDQLAQKEKNPAIQFTCAPLPGTLNFSFSGIKTAVLYYHQKHQHQKDYKKAHVASAFQSSVVEILVKKSLTACQQYKSNNLLIGGGVAANSYLRKRLHEEGSLKKINIFFPELALCMDNAAMIAGLGYHFNKSNIFQT